MSVHAAYPPQGQPTMMAPVYISTSPPGHGLRICTVVFGVLGLLVWCISLGFLIGWGYGYYSEVAREVKIFYGNTISIPANIGMIYAAGHIIFLVLEDGFPGPATPRDLRRRAGTMLTFTLMGFSAWVASIVWISLDTTDNFKLYHACNYGFIIGFLVTLQAGLLSTVTKRAQDMNLQQRQGTALKNIQRLNPEANQSFTPI